MIERENNNGHFNFALNILGVTEANNSIFYLIFPDTWFTFTELIRLLCGQQPFTKSIRKCKISRKLNKLTSKQICSKYFNDKKTEFGSQLPVPVVVHVPFPPAVAQTAVSEALALSE